MSNITKDNYLQKLFIDEAKPALSRHSGSGGGESGNSPDYYDTFWDVYQQNGERIWYAGAFCNSGWTDEIFAPKYDLTIQSGSDILTSGHTGMFTGSNINDLKGCLERAGVSMVFTNLTSPAGTFYGAQYLTRVPILDFRNSRSITYLFYKCYNLEYVEKILISNKCTDRASFPFCYCRSLKHVIFEGEICISISMEDCKLLSKESITSVINCLSDVTSSGVSFSTAAVQKAFETSEGANDGDVSTEWTTLVATKPNWTITLL